MAQIAHVYARAPFEFRHDGLALAERSGQFLLRERPRLAQLFERHPLAQLGNLSRHTLRRSRANLW
jgi:hypothetical protein